MTACNGTLQLHTTPEHRKFGSELRPLSSPWPGSRIARQRQWYTSISGNALSICALAHCPTAVTKQYQLSSHEFNLICRLFVAAQSLLDANFGRTELRYQAKRSAFSVLLIRLK